MANRWIKWVAGSAGVGVFTLFLAVAQPTKQQAAQANNWSDDATSPTPSVSEPLLVNSQSPSSSDVVMNHSSPSSTNMKKTSPTWLVSSAVELENIAKGSSITLKNRELLLESLDWTEQDTLAITNTSSSKSASTAQPSQPSDSTSQSASTAAPASTVAPVLTDSSPSTIAPTSTPAPVTKPKSDRKTRRS